MKTIKVLSTVLLFSTFFVACESESLNEEIGYNDGIEDVYGEDEADEVQPDGVGGK